MTRNIFKTIPGFPRYEINKSGTVRTKINQYNKEKEILGKANKGDIQILLICGLKPREDSDTMGLKRSTLVMLTHSELPEYLKGLRYIVKHLDGNTSNNRLENLCYFHSNELEMTDVVTPYKTLLLDNLEQQGFKSIPGFEKYATNIDASLVINISKGTTMEYKGVKPLKRHIVLTHGDKCFRRRRAWIVAQTWKDLEDEFKGEKNLSITHIGDIENYHPDNLEVKLPKFVTYDYYKSKEGNANNPPPLEGYVEVKDFPNYLINKEGKIWNISKGTFKTWGSCNIVVVGFYSEAKQTTRQVNSLMLRTFSTIPEHLKHIHKSHLSIKHLDGDQYNLNIENLCYYNDIEWCIPNVKSKYIKKQRKEMLQDGFKSIPGFDSYGINKEGTEVRKMDCSHPRLLTPLVSGSLTTRVKPNGKLTKVMHLDVLVFRTWSNEKIPDTYFRLIHLDGDRSNNHIDNLKIGSVATN